MIKLNLSPEEAQLVLNSLTSSISLMESDSRHREDIVNLERIAIILKASIVCDQRNYQR